MRAGKEEGKADKMSNKRTITREVEGRMITFRAEAPTGQVWKASGGDVHELVSSCYRGNKAWEREARKDVEDRAAMGTEPCAILDCEWCEEGGAR